MRYSVLVGLMLVSCLGCNVKEMRREQAGARQAILRLYEDQIVDNLIRAHVGLPIVHVEYTSVQGTLTSNRKLTVAPTRQETDNNLARGATGALLSRALNWTLAVTGEGSQNNALQVVGAPATDPKVLEAYVRYLNEMEDKPAAPTTAPTTSPTTSPSAETIDLRDSDNRKHLKFGSRLPARFHIDRAVPGGYYWIPDSSRRRFFKLYQEVTFTGKAQPKGNQQLLNQLELLRLQNLTD